MAFLHSSLTRWILIYSLCIFTGGVLGQQSIQEFEGCFRPIEGQDVTIKCRGTDNIDPHAAQKTSWSTTGSSFPSTITLGYKVQKDVNDTLRLYANYSALQQKWTYDLTILNYNRSYDGNFKCELQTLNETNRMEHIDLTKIPSIKYRSDDDSIRIVRNGNHSYYPRFVKYLVFTNKETGSKTGYAVPGENGEEIKLDVSTLGEGSYNVSSCYCGDWQSKGEGDTTGCYDHQDVAIESRQKNGCCDFTDGTCGYILKGWVRVDYLNNTGPCSGLDAEGRQGFLCFEEFGVIRAARSSRTTIPPLPTTAYSYRVFESPVVEWKSETYNISISYATTLGEQQSATLNFILKDSNSSYFTIGNVTLGNKGTASWTTAHFTTSILASEDRRTSELNKYQIIFELTSCGGNCSYAIDYLKIEDVPNDPGKPGGLGLSPEAIAGISVAVVAIVIGVIVIVVVVWKKKKEKEGK